MKTPSEKIFYTVSPKRRFRGRHLVVILLILGTAFGAYRKVYRPASRKLRQRQSIETPASQSFEATPQIASATKPGPETSDPFETHRLIVHAGDTLPGIFKALGIPNDYSNEWANACKSAGFGLLKEDDELIFVLSRGDGLPVKVVYLQSGGISYTLQKNSSGWECRAADTAEARGKAVRCALSDNFYDSAIAGGLPTPIITSLADIFSYDIDLVFDLKEGDSVSVFFQEYPIQSGQGKQFLILGAEMIVSGKDYQAFGFQLPDGSWDYFDAKGVSLRRAFLKSPINYRALSSSKTGGNIKPAVKVSPSPRGIGYFVPKGTAVCSIGDGFVSAIHRGARRNLSIEVRHRGGYSSWYGNLYSCSHGLKRGSPVSQAEQIGSVGTIGSGKAYLDFRLYKSGKPVHFQTADFARSKSIPKPLVSEFEKARELCSTALHGATNQNKQ